MVSRPWLEKVRTRLAKSGLPPSYVQRFVEELADHLHDLKEEDMSTEANVESRLGNAEQVAEAAVVAYRQRSFLGRHPTAAFAVFGISPVATMIALVVLMAVGMRVIGPIAEQFGWVGDNARTASCGPLALAATNYAFSLLFVIVPSILAGFLYGKLAGRLGIGRTWVFVSCAVLAAMALMHCWIATTTDLAGHKSVAVRLGFWIPLWCSVWPPSVRQLLQFLAPLAIGLWIMRRGRKEQQAFVAAGNACKAA